jgi:hypothetical protein
MRSSRKARLVGPIEELCTLKLVRHQSCPKPKRQRRGGGEGGDDHNGINHPDADGGPPPLPPPPSPPPPPDEDEDDADPLARDLGDLMDLDYDAAARMRLQEIDEGDDDEEARSQSDIPQTSFSFRGFWRC